VRLAASSKLLCCIICVCQLSAVVLTVQNGQKVFLKAIIIHVVLHVVVCLGPTLFQLY